MTAIVVLGMHRSGTSCLAGMLAAGGLASAGEAVRNWDNLRGHHEMLDAVRLNEAVLAHSGGHWLAPVAPVRWSAGHAAARERLLATTIAGGPALVKDPRTLLTLPFWRAAAQPFHVIAIVRHPLAVARSLATWRGMALADGVALWLAHNRALADDRERHPYPLIDFECSREEVIAGVLAACRALGPVVDSTAVAAAYDDTLVHHDDDAPPALPGLDEAVALYRRLTGRGAGTLHRRFPHRAWTAFTEAVRAGDREEALSTAQAAAQALPDVAAVLVPAVSALLRRRWFPEAHALVAGRSGSLTDGLADLLLGKVALAAGEAEAAATHLAAACAVPRPLFQARHLLPQALRQCGRVHEARTALAAVAGAALYPHGPLATLAEWAWLDGDRAAALQRMDEAITAAPLRRRGRLRTRRAEWSLATGDEVGARSGLERAVSEDPDYPRARTLLESLPRRT